MADNTPDKKNIEEAKQALNDYNESLRESISLSRVLSDTIQSAAKKFNGINVADRKLIDTTKELNKTLIGSLNLTDKLNAGKLKQKDIDTQLAKLEEIKGRLTNDIIKAESRIAEEKAKQIDLDEKGFKQLKIKTLEEEAKANSNRILKAKTDQLKLEDEILKKVNLYNTEVGASEELFAKRRELVSNIETVQSRERQAMAAGNSAGIQLAQREKKEFNESLKLIDYRIKEQDRILINQEKELSELKKQKEEADKIVNTYEELVKFINEEILQNKSLNDILEAQRKELEKQTVLSKLQSKNIKTFNEGLKEATIILGPLVAAFDAIKTFAFGISDQVTKLQKNLVLSRDEAYELRQDFNNMAVASGEVAVNTNRLIEANAALGKQLGFNSKFTDDLNTQFVILTKQIGLSEEAAGGLAKLSIATGATLEESTNIALETSQRLSSQYGIQLNQREVLEEIGKISGQTLAIFKASPQALAQAVAQAKLLGTNLDTVNKQAKSLLNFETSIENELQAELLTGQQLNLERARSASLAGDLVTTMKELNNQNIDFNKFSNMNVIAQEKLANALGLSADELSNQLLKQQYMGKSQEEVVALAGKEVAERLKALNAQDRFNLAVEKMQDLVSKFVGGPLGSLVDAMASITENAFTLYTTIGLIAAISLTKTIMSLALMATQLRASAIGAAATSAFLSPVNLALGIAGLAVAAGIIGSLVTSNEPEEFAEGGIVYGKTNAIVGEYSGVENNPEVIAPLSDLQNMINTNKQTIVKQDNTEMVSLLKSLRDEMRSTKENTRKFVDKKLYAAINPQQMGTEQLKTNTNLA